MNKRVSDIVKGDGYAVGHLDAMGDGYGFRKIRRELGVNAFGINALVLPPRYGAPAHSHQRQEETYFVHRGEVEIEFVARVCNMLIRNSMLCSGVISLLQLAHTFLDRV